MTNLAYFVLIGLEIFNNLLSIWPFLKSIEVYIVKSKHFPFLKQSLAFFNCKHLATLCGTLRVIQASIIHIASQHPWGKAAPKEQEAEANTLAWGGASLYADFFKVGPMHAIRLFGCWLTPFRVDAHQARGQCGVWGNDFGTIQSIPSFREAVGK